MNKRILNLILLTLLFITVSGCHFFQPYHPIYSQGNIITQEQFEQLRPGMSAGQVVVIMGTPMLVNTFNDHTLLYVYTLQKEKKFKEYKRVVLYFEGNRLVRIDPYFPEKPPKYKYW